MITSKNSRLVEALVWGAIIIVFVVLALLTNACGPQGPQGATGATGLQGPPGANGTQITVIQFCPGTPSYPSTFPEVGLCINEQIYAVYSANDGFLTLVTPGYYASNAIGSACNFTVLPNCVVQN